MDHKSSKLFEEYTTILQTLEKVDCFECSDKFGKFHSNLEGNNGFYGNQESAWENSKQIEYQQSTKEVVEVHALILSFASIIIGFILKFSLNGLIFLCRNAEKLTLKILEEVFNRKLNNLEWNLIFFKTFVKGYIENFNFGKLIASLKLFLVLTYYILLKILFYIIKLLLIEVTIK